MDNEMSMVIAAGALIMGLIFGAVIQRSRFCMAAVVSNMVLMGDRRHLHAWMVTMLVAIAGGFILEFSGLVDISLTSYRDSHINIIGTLFGGLLFGIGAIFAGGCIGRVLTQTGEGNLGALLALLTLAFGAMASYVGFVEPMRLWMDQLVSYEASSGDASLSSLLNLPLWVPAMVITSLIILYLYRHRHHDISPRLLFAGAVVGLLVLAGWILTGWLAVDEFTEMAPHSLTFSGPIASSALWISIGNQPATLFGISLVAGTLLGSFLSAVLSRTFRLTPPNPASIGRILAGGFMMGTGAICAGGCNIGQGVTGLSTLSVESIFAVAAIFSGMYVGVKWLQFSENHGYLWKMPRLLHLHRPQQTPHQQQDAEQAVS